MASASYPVREWRADLARWAAMASHAFARGGALVLGGLLVFDGARAAFLLGHPGAQWVDTRWLPGFVAAPVLVAVGLVVALGALGGRRSAPHATVGLAIVATHALRDAISCAPRTGLASFSALLFAAASLAAVSLWQAAPLARGAWRSIGVGAVATLVALPLAQMWGAAHARYEAAGAWATADAVVVLGARVYADGSPSLALYDRVRTGCELVKRGRARKLVVSGGPGDGAVHETDTMRRIAIECGVSPDAIVVDRAGLSTAESAANVVDLIETSFDYGARPRLVLVSHDYHLARARLAFDAAGARVTTVPARESRPLIGYSYFAAREVPAYWVYYLERRGST